MTYSILFSFVLIGLDLYCLAKLECSALLFHLCYLNLGMNAMCILSFIKEEVETWKLFSYSKMSELKD